MKTDTLFNTDRAAKRKRGGFTLIELLTVMAIAVILLLAAVPALKSIQGSSMQVAARLVANELQLARQYAVTRRNPVRFLIAVDNTVSNLDLIYRAYTVCEATNDANGNVVGWVPLTDWKLLPTGVVFSDVNTRYYDTIHATNNPPLGAATRTNGVAASSATAWQYFDNTNSMSVANNNPIFIGSTTQSWTASFVEFRPTGYVTSSSIQVGVGAAGIRLVLGSVLDPNTGQILVTSTNNWVYVEYDQFGGRVRVRYPDSYDLTP